MTNLKIAISPDFFKDESKELIVSSDTKKLWSVLLDLYAEFKRVCDENGLRYFADSGTMIGALRHEGFIPWDDDIDLLMFREDYERLCRIAPTAFKHPYFWQTNFSDPGSCRGHAQLRNSETTGMLKSEMRDGKSIYKFNQGIFIDIFQLDKVPNALEERDTFCREIQKQRNKIAYLKHLLLDFRVTKRDLISPAFYVRVVRYVWYRILKSVFGCDVMESAYRKLEVMAQRYNNADTDFCAPIEFRPTRRPREFYAISGFNRSRIVKFEMLEIPVPENAEEMLTGQYGDWHKHVVGGSAHGGLFIDLNKSYKEYLPK